MLLKEFRQHYKWAIESHDQYLDKRGPTSKSHRTFALPIDEKLRKKKKYRKVKRQQSKEITKIREYHPLFKYGDDLNLKVSHFHERKKIKSLTDFSPLFFFFFA